MENEMENPFRPEDTLFHEVDPIVEAYKRKPYPPSLPGSQNASPIKNGNQAFVNGIFKGNSFFLLWIFIRIRASTNYYYYHIIISILFIIVNNYYYYCYYYGAWWYISIKAKMLLAIRKKF